MLNGPEQYGRHYWCIKTKLSKSGEIFVHADDVRILPDGTLSLIRIRDGQPPAINLVLAPGNWNSCYAASAMDGAPLAIEFWEGQHERKSA